MKTITIEPGNTTTARRLGQLFGMDGRAFRHQLQVAVSGGRMETVPRCKATRYRALVPVTIRRPD